ncbi:MAG TPA: GAF domain-containing sensor histidine kinase [Acidimicrobiales bacterium]
MPDFRPPRGPTTHRRSSWLQPLARIGRASDGYDSDDVLAMLEQVDRIRAFGPALLAIRWGTTIVSIALAAEAFTKADWWVVGWCGVVLAYTVLRTISPIRYLGNLRSLLLVLAELALHVAAVASTGYWESPFVFSLATAVIVAGFARGFGFALRIGIATATAVSLAFVTRPDFDTNDFRIMVQWSVIMILVAIIAGYTRRISGEADRQRTLAIDRLTRLSDANALLFSLHRVAQSLPASLDMNEVLDTTMARLRGLLDFDAVAILIFDDTDANWQVLRREGLSLPARLGPTELPPMLKRALAKNQLIEVPDLAAEGAAGLSTSAGCGLYTVLAARGSVIGLLALEHKVPNHFSRRDVEMLNGFVEPVALAIDNARWFSRLRTVGADEERTRIARDLHDRIGQSLAYLAFELDRIVTREAKGEDISSALLQLRNDIRGVIREVRDTLYDLRTDVSEGTDIGETLQAFAERLRERSSLQVELYCDRGPRLPILQEREMWRIAQEALVNVERHANARRVEVRWRCDGRSAALEIVDDGDGFPPGKAGRLDSYGMIGMRERASSIGATLDIISAPGKGTAVRCVLAPTSVN